MKTRYAALTAVLLLALTGCAGTADDSSSGTETGGETAAPLVAETTEAPEGDDAEASFVDYVRENLPEGSVIPNATDEQLIAAGAEACDRLAAGEDSMDLSVIEGEEKDAVNTYRDSVNIIVGAKMFLCPA